MVNSTDESNQQANFLHLLSQIPAEEMADTMADLIEISLLFSPVKPPLE